jgi:hypothetical protein
MRKLARFAALVAWAAAVTVPAIGSAQTMEVSERIHRAGTNLGFEESDLDKLAQGEIVSRELEEDSKKELALAVAMVVKGPFGEDTLIFYTNRTFTDQVAGFGSGTKHTIGRKMMLGEVVKLFESIRASFEAASG